MKLASSLLPKKHRTFSVRHLVAELSTISGFLTPLIEEDDVKHDGRDGHTRQCGEVDIEICLNMDMSGTNCPTEVIIFVLEPSRLAEDNAGGSTT